MLKSVGALCAVLPAWCLLSAASLAQNDVVDGNPPADTIWLRQQVPLAEPTSDSTTLNLVTPGTASIYFNGQRLGRNLSSAETGLAWDISSLVRAGANSVAVSVTYPIGTAPAEERVRPLSVWLSTPGRTDRTLTTWKLSDTPPPVGWQQTDFNDRDWKAGPQAAVQPLPHPEQPQKLEWAPQSGRSRLSDGRFQFRQKDHVLLLGGTFIERAQEFGYLECALSRPPGVTLTFRNLGWSADTVFAESRGIFDSPEKGYERLIEHVRAEEPSVIIVCYGQNEAMSFPDGEAGLTRFRRQLRQLHNDLITTGAEIVFLSPHPFVAMKPPLPNPSRWNDRLQQYANAVRDVAAETQAVYVDLFTDFIRDMERSQRRFNGHRLLPPDWESHPDLVFARNEMWTENGIHWNHIGYRSAAAVVADRLFGTVSNERSIRVEPASRSLEATGGDARVVSWGTADDPRIVLHYQASYQSPQSVVISTPATAPPYMAEMIWRDSRFKGEVLDSAVVKDGPDGSDRRYTTNTNEAFEYLRELVVRKNELYFHRWRPQNITYLFGFRKHEQGNNASEIAQFDPLIDELEAQIHKARQPLRQTFTLRPAK
ncbi:MAG: GDSL-type esterase/lipase family protein [Fuerstiella sp.]